MSKTNQDPVKQRIFKGAQAALVQYSLSKLNMSDVYRAAGVSRATLYRYFPSREILMQELRQWEVRCFIEDSTQALASAPPQQRLQIMLDNLQALPEKYPSLIPLLENDPGYVLGSLKQLFPTIKNNIHQILEPIFADTRLDPDNGLNTEQLVDCFLRIAITVYLFPDPTPGTTEKTMLALYNLWKTST